MSERISSENEAEMKRLIMSKHVKYVRVEVVDLNGCSRGVQCDANYFLNNYKKGFVLYQSNLGRTVPGEFIKGTWDDISFGKGCLLPDLETFSVLPWLDKTASVIVDFRTGGFANGPLHPCSTRVICKEQLNELNTLGYQLYSAFEYEFYLLDKDTKSIVNHDVNNFSIQNAGRYAHIANEVMDNMNSIGIQPERFHSEFGPGQFELTWSPAFGIKCSDNAFRYKQLVKYIFSKHGYMATFLSKPFHNFSGSSGHFNHSLWDVNGKNAFDDRDEKYGISEIGQHWLAGLRYHADTLVCFASPTPNCFERMNLGDEDTPKNDGWGLDNHRMAYRVKEHNSENIFIENRLSASGANPYLLTAACIIAGMDGIKRRLPLQGDPYEGGISKAAVLPDDVRLLPKSLSSSIECLVGNEVFVQELGHEFIQVFSRVKKYEHEMAEKKKTTEKEELFKWYMDYYGKYI